MKQNLVKVFLLSFLVLLFFGVGFLNATTCVDDDGDGFCAYFIYPSGGESFEAGDIIDIKIYQEGASFIFLDYTSCQDCSTENSIVSNEKINPDEAEQNFQFVVPEYSTDKEISFYFSSYTANGIFDRIESEKIFIKGVPPTEPSCFDSDNGKDFYTKGYIDASEDGSDIFRLEDYCTEGWRLMEYYCDEGKRYNAQNIEIRCSGGCNAGACNPEERDLSVKNITQKNTGFLVDIYYTGNLSIDMYDVQVFVRENNANGNIFYNEKVSFIFDPLHRRVEPGDIRSKLIDYQLLENNKYWIKVVVDPENTIEEINENNNEKIVIIDNSNNVEDDIQDEDEDNNNSNNNQFRDMDNSAKYNSNKNRKIEKIKSGQDRLILKLKRKITALENRVVELEKKFTKKIDKALTKRMAGQVLLQVEPGADGATGQAWYVDGVSGNKFYMKDGQSAYEMLKAFGLGITTDDLLKIPLGYDQRLVNDLIDSDGDTLSDTLEEALGTDPYKKDTDGDGYNDDQEIRDGFRPDASGRYIVDQKLVDRLGNGILLQVSGKNARGQAWLMKDGKRYYIDPRTAYNAMRYLSLGIDNNDIRKIQVGEVEE